MGIFARAQEGRVGALYQTTLVSGAVVIVGFRVKQWYRRFTTDTDPIINIFTDVFLLL